MVDDIFSRDDFVFDLTKAACAWLEARQKEERFHSKLTQRVAEDCFSFAPMKYLATSFVCPLRAPRAQALGSNKLGSKCSKYFWYLSPGFFS